MEYRPIYEKGRWLYVHPGIPFNLPDHQQWIDEQTKFFSERGIVPIVVLTESDSRTKYKEMEKVLKGLKRDPNFPVDDFLLIVFDRYPLKKDHQPGDERLYGAGCSGKNVAAKYPWLETRALKDEEADGPYTGIFEATKGQFDPRWHREMVVFAIDLIVRFISTYESQEVCQEELIVSMPNLEPVRTSASPSDPVIVMLPLICVLLTACFYASHQELACSIAWAFAAILCLANVIKSFGAECEVIESRESLEGVLKKYKERLSALDGSLLEPEESKWKKMECKSDTGSAQSIKMLQNLDQLVDALRELISEARDLCERIEKLQKTGKHNEAVNLLQNEVRSKPHLRICTESGDATVDTEDCKPVNHLTALLSAANDVQREIDARRSILQISEKAAV